MSDTPIPPPCEACAPTGGTHRYNLAGTGLERCDCARGKWLAELAKPKRKQPKRQPSNVRDSKALAAGDV